VTFLIFVTDDGSATGCAPVLVTQSDQVELPPHPEGGNWRWILTSSEKPTEALNGRKFVRLLQKHGYAVSDLPLDRLLRVRLAPVRLSLKEPKPTL
jgi:hypothetical protein